MMAYSDIAPIESPIAADRQGAKRHYGVHPYFTRRPYNVVRQYILHYSREGDCVLDPFGGSGVTAIEAFLENRTGIQNDINPLANFIAQGIADLRLGDLSDYQQALAFLKESCEGKLAQLQSLDEAGLRGLLDTLKLPENVALPSNADVERYHALFAPRQLAALSILKEAIAQIADPHAQKGMLLAWSATLGKLNKTFLSAEGRAESRGGSSIFSIYRYKVAKEPIELPPWQTFHERALNLIAAKKEIDRAIELKRQTQGWRGEFQARAQDIEELSAELKEQVDYIFTDPPYGGHISYLDLSTLWNVWLNQTPDVKAREKELIVGGEMDLSEEQYVNRLGESVRACIKMLKKGRWLSLVFQHWDTAYFDAILTSAAESGADLRAAVSQIGDPIWSMHKKKSKQSVLAGEMILTFCKTGAARRVEKNGRFDVSKAVGKILSANASDRIYGEYLFNKIVIEAWNRRAIGSLNISKTEFIDLIKQHGWSYDEEHHFWIKRQPASASLFSALH
jgi:16S rRNA G966 N2-methylase RsmD